jgi:type VI secretion system protein ImpL
MAQIQKSLSAVAAYMQKVNDEQTAFKAAAELTSGKAQNPIVQLLQQANQAPEPVRHLLREVVHQSAALIFAQARPYINAAWQADVYPGYGDNLRGRYPFDQSADDEVAIADFIAFFGKQGNFGKFFQTHIKPFVREEGGRLVWKQVVGQTIGFSDKTLSMLNRLNYIQNAYLAGGQKLAVTFTMQPVTLNSQIASADVIIGDNTFTYKHGPRFPTTITWPGKAGGSVSVSLTGLDGGVYSVSKQGDWGLLRLFDQYSLAPKDAKSALFHINMGSGRDVSYMLRATSAYNPLNLTIIHGLKLVREL